MKLLPLLLALILCATTGLHAASIRGSVLDNNGNAIADATVSLLRGADSQWLRSELTASDGSYALSADAGSYLLQVSAAGYKEQSKIISLEKDEQLRLDFILVANALQGVTVTSKKPFIEAKPGMMIVNVEGSAASAGSNALELLQRSPGVQVDPQGNVSMRGKNGVAVYLDGRPSRLSGDQLTALLKSMTAEEIAQLELITQPGARYEAAGTAGIINIRTRNIKKRGLNGSLGGTYTRATENSGNLTGRITYQHNRLTLYASEYFNYVNNYNTLQVDRHYSDPNTGQPTGDVYTDQTVRFLSRFHRIKAGAEYALSNSTTIGIRAQMPIGNPKVDYRNLTTITDYPSSTSTYNTGTRDMDNLWYEKEIGLLAKHQFKDGGTLSFDGYYILNHGGDHGLFINTPTSAGGQAIAAPDLWDITFPVDIRLSSAQTDYSRSLGKKSKLEAGLKGSNVDIDYTSSFLVPDNTGVFMADTSRSSRFFYNETIAAAYATITRTFSHKLEAQAGLRAEQTNTRGDVVGKGASFSRSYLSLFPTVFASYKADSSNSFTFSYGRRLDRPNYYMLNPARDYIDKYSYRVGNPALKPQFNNNFELGYSWKDELTVTLSFMQTSGVISDFFVQDDQTKTAYEVHDNIAGYRQGGLSLNYNRKLTKWWTANLYGDFYLKEYHGNYFGIDYRQQGRAFSFNASNQFRLGGGWNAELSGWYNGAGLETVFTRPQAMGSLDVAVSKKLFSDSLTIKLAANDVLGTQQYRANNRFANFDTDVSSTWDARRAVLSVNYNFGKNIALMQRRSDAEGRNM